MKLLRNLILGLGAIALFGCGGSGGGEEGGAIGRVPPICFDYCDVRCDKGLVCLDFFNTAEQLDECRDACDLSLESLANSTAGDGERLELECRNRQDTILVQTCEEFLVAAEAGQV